MINKIKNYQIVSKIASGGMSDVYLADDLETGKKVALKILDSKLSIDPEYLNRFKKEASICQQLDHKNIVKILSYGTFEESYYIAYEYIEGTTLEKLIRQKALTIAEIENISIQILAGLSFAHSKSIIHRDIKPSNIIIEDGVIKILDFGIAKQELTSTVTKSGLFMGSPHYVSPEQIEGHDIDYRSDLYSFGIVLYEMIEGRVPFSADTPWGIIRAHLDKKAPEITKDAPGYLKEVVYKSLSKRKEDRFRSANEIISAIANKEETGKKTVIIDRVKIKTTSNVNNKKPKIKLPTKIRFTISLPIVFISLWFLSGGIFYTFGNRYFNNGSYLDAALNYRVAGMFLIPNAAYNMNNSLDQKYTAIIKLLNGGKYEDMANNTNLLKGNFPEYKKINEIAPLLKQHYETYLIKEDYDNAKKILNGVETSKLWDDKFTKEELEKVENLMRVKNLITQAKSELNDKKYEQSLTTIEKAVVLAPDHKAVNDAYNEIKSKLSKYNSFLNEIDNIFVLFQQNSLEAAYEKTNNLFSKNDFKSIALQSDMDKLNDLKDRIYSAGKNVVNNSSKTIYFSGYTNEDMKYFKNIFGNTITSIRFSGWTSATDAESKYCSFAINIGWGEPKVILYSQSDIIYADSGKNAINVDRKSYPSSIIDVARKGKAYIFGENNFNYIVRIERVSIYSYWFSSLEVSVTIQ